MSEPIFTTHWQKVGYFNGIRVELNNCGQEDRLDINVYDGDISIGFELTKSEAKAFAAVLVEFINEPGVSLPDEWSKL